MPKRILEGVVTANKNDKTVAVEVKRRVKHPLFGKVVTKSKKYQAHDEKNAVSIGDKVSIRECKPFSKSKRWEVINSEKKAN